MVSTWRGALLGVALLVILPAIGATWLWNASFDEHRERQAAGFRREMEDVLHRLLVESRPEGRVRALVERTLFRIRRGIPPERALRRVLARLGPAIDAVLFDAAGRPLPLPGHPVTKAAAWRRLFAALLRCRQDRLPPGKVDEKLAQQILGDEAGLSILAESRGHFRALGTPARYSHGAWWRLRVGPRRSAAGPSRLAPIRYHLLVLLKSRWGGGRDLLRSRVVRVAGRVRPLFRLALTGPIGSPSYRRLPRPLQQAIRRLPGGQGEVLTPVWHGVVRRAGRLGYLVAWQRRGAGRFPQRDAGQVVIFALAALTSLGLARLIVFEPPRAISLRWVVPGLLLAIALPIVVFFGLAMTEHRRRQVDNDIYETHRRIEARLRQIDQNFSLFLQRIARGYQQAFHRHLTTGDAAIAQALRQVPGAQGLYSAYLIDEAASRARTLHAARQNPANDQQLALETGRKLMGYIQGTRAMADVEDNFFVHYVRNLGWFVENKVLHSRRFQILDLRPDPRRPQGMTSLFLTQDRGPTVQAYCRQILSDPRQRGGIAFALVACDEGTLVEALPRAFRSWLEGQRLGEKVLRQGQTIDARLTAPSGRSYLVTCLQGRHLGEFLLVGAVEAEQVEATARRLRAWMVASLAGGILLALAVGLSLVEYLLWRLREVARGIDQIAAHRPAITVACPDGDEFGEVARGLERAAVTLEEVYSSLPIQETLVRCEPLAGPAWFLAGGFDAGSDPGGDFLDAFPIGAERYVLAVGDVFGEGWQTTLLVAAMRVALRLQVQRAPDRAAPQVAEALRRHFLQVRSVVKHMAFGLGLLDRRDGGLEWIGAGICPPYLIRQGEGRYLPAGHPPLGAGSQRPFQAYRETLAPGDTLILYTDGWIKTMNQQGHPLGFATFAACLRRAQRPDPGAMIEALRQELVMAGFTDREGDDRSIMVVTRARPPAEEPTHV
ncbi:MAG: Serine phosphatase RsbU, regulator of sigma subunit [Candidatus Ozemobacter sibiricus]|uniref:Serine phosphatase RsbU, regulator of sigma subunit n=1 Tax=Candidatus Ozemobacter sibiricus TaxID=2268124 RepID=A0A367ZMY1_9BACT|nr:MAG: Serine phosphatase RsbU, regulator of sigma subunit [Candidatus Ozemobacter sibiricus]